MENSRRRRYSSPAPDLLESFLVRPGSTRGGGTHRLRSALSSASSAGRPPIVPALPLDSGGSGGGGFRGGGSVRSLSQRKSLRRGCSSARSGSRVSFAGDTDRNTRRDTNHRLVSSRPLTARSFGSTYTPRLDPKGTYLSRGSDTVILKTEVELAVDPRAVASDDRVALDASRAQQARRGDPRREVEATRRPMIAPCDREIVEREMLVSDPRRPTPAPPLSSSTASTRSSTASLSSSSSSLSSSMARTQSSHHGSENIAPTALKTPRERRLELYAEIERQETTRAARVIAGRERRMREVQRQRTRYPNCPALPGASVESHNVYAETAKCALGDLSSARRGAIATRAQHMSDCGGETAKEEAPVPIPRKRVSEVTQRDRGRPNVFEFMTHSPPKKAGVEERRRQIHENSLGGRKFDIVTGKAVPQIDFSA